MLGTSHSRHRNRSVKVGSERWTHRKINEQWGLIKARVMGDFTNISLASQKIKKVNLYFLMYIKSRITN